MIESSNAVNYEMAYVGCCVERDELERMLKKVETDFRTLKELVICDFHGPSGQKALEIIEGWLARIDPSKRS